MFIGKKRAKTQVIYFTDWHDKLSQEKEETINLNLKEQEQTLVRKNKANTICCGRILINPEKTLHPTTIYSMSIFYNLPRSR